MRLTSSNLGVVTLIVLASFGQSSLEMRRAARDECIALLSGFPKDAPVPQPPYPTDPSGITLEYFTSGCYGNCPAFTLTISKGIARFDGHAYVRSKGKRTAKPSERQLEAFLHAWYDGDFYAMRDNYCDVSCPDGTLIIVTDIPESSIKMTTPDFTKRVYQCFSTVDNRPQTPKPPDAYFDLSRQMRAFAEAQHWL